MSAAPQVQSLNDIIGQITAAQAPEQATIDKNITDNETSGAGQVAGLNAAKTNAFSGIEQNASNKGMYFSGFSPNAEAGYTGSTYLPGLAKIQSIIASTRNTLMGQKAALQTEANTGGINEHNRQTSALDNYNMEQERQANAAAEAEKTRQFEAAQGAANRSAAAAKAPSISESRAAAMGSLQGDLTHAFNGFGARPSFYTEHTIIPTLLQAYAGSGLTNKEITDAIYGTRKALGYG